MNEKRLKTSLGEIEYQTTCGDIKKTVRVTIGKYYNAHFIYIEDATKYAKLNEQTKPYNTDIEDEKIVNSWLYEYSIFELVRLFKKFDWENDVLLLYGW